MAEPMLKDIPLEDLIIDLTNPRHPQQLSQRDALHVIVREQGPKLCNLAEDIVKQGLNPTELVMVTPPDEHGLHTVLEGNRRVAALKLLSSPDLLKSMGLRPQLDARYKELQQKAISDSAIPTSIPCAVVPREDATHWIQLKHTGENGGVGIVTWDGVASERFRGGSPALEAIEMVARSEYLDEETKKNLHKIAITNVERVLSTPEARQIFGVEVKNGHLSIVGPDQDEALARLAILVRDIANKTKKVSDLDTKPQRIEYAQQVAAMPRPTPGGSAGTGSSTGADTAHNRTAVTRRINPHRKTLIPHNLILTIRQTRINQIYHELQQVKVEEFVNCCAVMLRVFIELSVDEYAKQKKISLKTQPRIGPSGTPVSPPRDLSLREKIRTVAEYLQTNSLCTRSQLQGVRALIDKHGHVLSVDSMNGYVHNQDYSPTAPDLRTNWDNVQPFVAALWTP